MAGKEGNSYTLLLDMIKDHGKNVDTCLSIGTVTSIDPLIVNMGKYEIDEEDIIINNGILETEYEAEVTIEDAGIKDKKSTIKIKPVISEGDNVIIAIFEDDFYLIGKVW